MRPGKTHVYAQYTIRVAERERVADALKAQGIPTAVYYPKCLHEQPVFAGLGYRWGAFPEAERASREVLSLPMHPFLTEREQERMIAAIQTLVGSPFAAPPGPELLRFELFAMKHRIDPKVDCVFKALLGAEGNRRLLIHFLNAMLGGELAAPITEVEILNPYHEREFLSDKLSIVDVKARDQGQRQYQIEIQLLNVMGLPGRIAYGWAELYRSQLKKGDGYDQLKPAYSLWLLGEALWPKRDEALHWFRLRDGQGRDLLDHGGIWLVELSKCVVDEVHTEQERWLKFFVEGEGLDEAHLPAWMQTEEMKQAMSTLQGFSDQERAYHRYQARQDYLRQQKSIENRMRALQAEAEQARAAEERERTEKEAARAEKEAALAEIARLKALLQVRSEETS